MSATLVFDSMEPIEVPVTIGKDKYILREACHEGATKYRSAIVASEKILPDGSRIWYDYAECEAVLLSYCLHQVVERKDGATDLVRVSEARIRAMKYRISHPLFEKAREITMIRDEDQSEEAIEAQIAALTTRLEAIRANKSPGKNSLSATVAGTP